MSTKNLTGRDRAIAELRRVAALMSEASSIALTVAKSIECDSDTDLDALLAKVEKGWERVMSEMQGGKVDI